MGLEDVAHLLPSPRSDSAGWPRASSPAGGFGDAVLATLGASFAASSTHAFPWAKVLSLSISAAAAAIALTALCTSSLSTDVRWPRDGLALDEAALDELADAVS